MSDTYAKRFAKLAKEHELTRREAAVLTVLAGHPAGDSAAVSKMLEELGAKPLLQEAGQILVGLRDKHEASAKAQEAAAVLTR